MADRQQPHQVLVHPQRYEGGFKSQQAGGGPSATKILAVVTLLPVGGGLLALAGITFVGSFIALCLATPVFILFSPVIVPAALVIGLATTAFLASGAFGLTGLSSISWVARCFQRATGAESLDQAKRRMQDMVGYVGLKTKDMGQEIQRKAHEGK